MEPWVIVLIVIGGIYLALLVTNIIFVVSFYIIMKHHNKAIKIILKSKLDSLKELMMKTTTKWGMTVNSEDTHLLDESELMLNDENFIINCDEIKKKLSYINNQLTSMCEEYDITDDDYQLLKENINQLDSVYRSNVIMYNADVLGYNYWIRFLPFRYLWLLFRLKTKDFIS